MRNHSFLGRRSLGLLSLFMAAAGCADDGTPTGQQQGVVFRDANGAVICDSATDTAAPVLTAKAPLKLWPPNHKFHDIKVEDCFSVADACQPGVKAEFVWASSDEPVDSIGDGHHAPDIQVSSSSCSMIALRAERQGPKEGRVYKLGVRAVDAAGNVAEGVCSVIVDHDQRGVTGADSGESYRVTFNGQNGQPLCEGENPPPVDPPTNNPPTNNPPTNNPPTNNPPTNNPPTNNPPTNNPPVNDPPVNDPPVNDPPSDNPVLF